MTKPYITQAEDGTVRLVGKIEPKPKKKPGAKPMLTPEQKDWAYRKWCEGYPVREIAKVLYVSESTVWNSFRGKRTKLPPLVWEGGFE